MKGYSMKMTWANRISILRVLLIAPFVAFMLKVNAPGISEQKQDLFRYAAFMVFIIMALSDAVDGYLARSKNQITKLGKFLDPMADKFLMACAAVLLSIPQTGIEGYMLPPTVVVLIIGKDMFLLMGFLVVYFTTLNVKIKPVLIGKIATALQLVMVAGILLGPEITLLIPFWIWILRVIWWSAAGTAVLATLIYTRNGSKMVEEAENSPKNEKS